MRNKVKNEKLLNQADVRRIVVRRLGVSEYKVGVWIRQGKLPKPHLELSHKSRYWLPSQIDNWLGVVAS